MILDETLPASLSLSRERFGDKVALVFGGLELTYVELDDMSSAFAAALIEKGAKSGDRVVLHMPNSAEWVIAYHGGLKAGCVVVPVNYALTGEELGFIAKNCQARLLVIHVERAALGAQLSEQLNSCAMLEVQPGRPKKSKMFGGPLSNAPIPTVDWEPLAPAMICYTSGTTGSPKGAMLSHQSASLNAKLTALMHGRGPDDITVSALPLPHVYGQVVMNSTFCSGGTLALFSTFDAAEALAAIETHKATIFEGVPTMYLLMLAEASLTKHSYHSLRLCTVGGQTMPLDKMQQIEEALNCPLIELWGMTELAGLGTTHPFTGPYQLGSIGAALPFLETRIAANVDNSNTAEKNEVGELLVRGPQVMLAYYENPQATAEAITEDGWLHTGDIARRDDNGFISIVDRKKDMLLCGGYNVYPAEIERVVSRHPSVAMVAVSSRTDQTKGDVPQAFIVLKPGADTDEAAIDSFCRKHLAAYKVPRNFYFVADLPKTSTGKVLRRALRNIDPKTLQMHQGVQG